HVLFFFQAEDGIRDYHVTGVQTCALPISSDHLHVRGEHVHQVLGAEQRGGPPPRAWRAPLAQTSGAALVRTTSTCVESTREASHVKEDATDHLHVRGEHDLSPERRARRYGPP